MNDNLVNNPKEKFNLWVFLGSSVWVLLIIMVFMRIFVFQQVSVVGASMEPSYTTGELLFVNQIGNGFRRGQVVAAYDNDTVAKDANYFTRFSSGTRFLLKRVVGLPGEEIEMIGDKVIIYNDEYPDGIILFEEYVSEKTKIRQQANDYYFPRTIIEKDHYFLLGDNRNNSTDSRRKGGFAEYAILGYETVKFWPVRNFEFFSFPDYKFIEVDDFTREEVESKRGEKSSNQGGINLTNI